MPKDDDGLTKRERTFADKVLEGMPATRAYQAAGYKANEQTARKNAYLVLRRPQVIAYMREERKALAELARLEKWQLVEYLTQVITTPVGHVDETSPLAQEYTVDEIGREKVRTRVKMIGKLDSAKLLASMLGWTTPDREKPKGNSKLSELIRLTRKSDGSPQSR